MDAERQGLYLMAEVLPGLASKVAPTLPLYDSVWADIAGPKGIRPFRETRD